MDTFWMHVCKIKKKLKTKVDKQYKRINMYEVNVNNFVLQVRGSLGRRMHFTDYTYLFLTSVGHQH